TAYATSKIRDHPARTGWRREEHARQAALRSARTAAGVARRLAMEVLSGDRLRRCPRADDSGKGRLPRPRPVLATLRHVLHRAPPERAWRLRLRLRRGGGRQRK